MNEGRLNAAFDELVPETPSTKHWEDVLVRARRLRRRRRRRTATIALCAGAVTLAASLAASGQIGLPVRHAHAPHLIVRATLVRPGGSRAGTIELELIRGMVAFGRRVVVQPFTPTDGDAVRTRWFSTLDNELENGTVSIRSRGAPAAMSSETLCFSCGTRASGSVDLSASLVTELLNRQAIFVAANGGRVVATGTASLDKSRLRRGLLCSGVATSHLRCTRIYTGRP